MEKIILTVKKDDFGVDETYNLFLWCERHKVKTEEPKNSEGLYDKLIIHLDTLEKQVLFESKYTARLKHLIDLLSKVDKTE